jgi:isopentenyl diphosphate isomerase/L-lactate dehydrogenase-like FMN-dependent dehydrogenase
LGYKGIAVTVDAPILGKRIGDERNKFKLPENLKLEVLS